MFSEDNFLLLETMHFPNFLLIAQLLCIISMSSLPSPPMGLWSASEQYPCLSSLDIDALHMQTSQTHKHKSTRVQHKKYKGAENEILLHQHVSFPCCARPIFRASVCSIIRSGAHWRKDYKSVSKVDRGGEDLDITFKTLGGRQVKRGAI